MPQLSFVSSLPFKTPLTLLTFISHTSKSKNIYLYISIYLYINIYECIKYIQKCMSFLPNSVVWTAADNQSFPILQAGYSSLMAIQCAYKFTSGGAPYLKQQRHIKTSEKLIHQLLSSTKQNRCIWSWHLLSSFIPIHRRCSGYQKIT